MANVRACLECGDSIHGRSDKKYCSDQCRTTYHNRRNSHGQDVVRTVNRVLRKNRRILARLHQQRPTKVRGSQLEKHGFSPMYFTNEYRTKSGKTYRFCYDYGYQVLANGYYVVVAREAYI